MSSLITTKKTVSKLLLGVSIFFSTFLGLNLNKAEAINPDITIPLGQIAPFQVPEGISTVAIGDESVATVVVPPGQNKSILIYTKSAGITNILVFTERGGAPNNFVLEVQDTKRNEQIVTRVKVLEMFTGDDGNLGVDWQDFISFREAPPSAPFKFGLPVRTSLLEAKINTMISDRKGKLLAQPTLVSLSGKEAKFLSGGEYPVLIYERDRVNIQWKEYGIRLSVTARVEGNDSIVVKLVPEVSSIDRANSVILTGSTSSGSAVIPAFTTRKAESTLVLKDNESIVIAGLINNTQETIDTKIPLLGDIPFLGFLFKTREFKNMRSELVFIVSPSILKSTIVNPEKNYADEAEKLEKK